MRRVLDRAQYVLGPEVEKFEARFADLVGAEHAIGVSSGTDALLAALMAMGIGPGDEVITSPFTFVAPAQAIARLGATPVFVDIDPVTYGLDPAAVQAAIGPNTVGVVPVHLFGQCTDMTALTEVAERHGLFVIEDAAQAVGARHAGHHAGTFGDFGCFSFFPTKTLGAFGDGGMVVTDDEELAGELRRIRHHGAEPKYVHHRLGGNFRLDALQAAILDVKLDHLDAWLQRRRANAAAYAERLPRAIQPAVAPNNEHAWHQYVVRIPDRDGVRDRLWSDRIETGVYYPSTLDSQPCFQDGAARVCGSIDRACRAAREVLALPVFAELTEEERDWVADRVATHLTREAA